MWTSSAVVWLFSASLMWQASHCLDNGLARTPPMGWLSWERFRCITDCNKFPKECISERLYMDMADRMVADGYLAAGYEYVNIDDCWSAKERDSNGKLLPDPERFPSGIKFLADYMHKRGLKLGIYGDMGLQTCGGYPGSKFYLQGDANTFAEWGVDSLKMDGCFSNSDEFDISYPVLGKFLNLTGRPILYSCSWPDYLRKANLSYVAEVCNIWRISHDMEETFEIVKEVIDYFGNNSVEFCNVSHPGAFGDPDQLILGNFALSYEQERVQMAMWAILAAPLLMSNDLRKIRKESRDLLLNKNIIAINQDPLGLPGIQIAGGEVQMWVRPISPAGSMAMAFLNYGINSGGPVEVEVILGKLGLSQAFGKLRRSNEAFRKLGLGLSETTSYNVTEGFTGQFLGIFKPGSSLPVRVNPSGVYLIVARPVDDDDVKRRTGY